MPKVNSFKDHNGKRGTVGSLVYHWMTDIVVNDAERAAVAALRAARARAVVAIVTQGAAGTQIKLAGDHFFTPAKGFVIYEPPAVPTPIEERGDGLDELRRMVRADVEKPVCQWTARDKQDWRDMGWKVPRKCDCEKCRK